MLANARFVANHRYTDLSVLRLSVISYSGQVMYYFFLSPRDLPGFLTPDNFSKFQFFSKSQTLSVISYSGQIFQSPKFFLSSKFFQSPRHRDFLLRTKFYVVLFLSPRNFSGFLTADNFYVVLFLSSIYVVTFSKSHLCSNFF